MGIYNPVLSRLSDEQLKLALHRIRWIEAARPDQLPPEEYFIWLLLAGRGAGKTRAGAEDMWWHASREPERIAVVGPTLPDVRKTCFEGESGLLSVIPKSFIKAYNRTSLELWLKNESYFIGYTSEEPERLRGPQHHRAWCEELCAWKNLADTWDMLMFGLRLGDSPRLVITTTPKPSRVLKEIVADEETIISRATTFDNKANLPKKFLDKLAKKYEGTRLGRQELYADILEAAEGALWNLDMIEAARYSGGMHPDKPTMPAVQMRRIVVAVDPAITAKTESNETGIIAAGLGVDGRGYVLRDSSNKYTPGDWATRVVSVFKDIGADRIVAEGNQGGEMVRHTIATEWRGAPITIVHASRGKAARAEPVAALYEQGRVSHVGIFTELEDQLVSWEPLSGMESPDRLDALVWALTDLMVSPTTVHTRELAF